MGYYEERAAKHGEPFYWITVFGVVVLSIVAIAYLLRWTFNVG